MSKLFKSCIYLISFCLFILGCASTEDLLRINQKIEQKSKLMVFHSSKMYPIKIIRVGKMGATAGFSKFTPTADQQKEIDKLYNTMLEEIKNGFPDLEVIDAYSKGIKADGPNTPEDMIVITVSFNVNVKEKAKETGHSMAGTHYGAPYTYVYIFNGSIFTQIKEAGVLKALNLGNYSFETTYNIQDEFKTRQFIKNIIGKISLTDLYTRLEGHARKTMKNYIAKIKEKPE